MSQLEFNKLYSSLRELPLDAEKYNKPVNVPKGKVVEHLISALTALKCAEETIYKQADAIMSTNMELVKLSAMTRIPQETTNANDTSSPKSYSNAVKQVFSPLVLKSNSDTIKFNNDEVKDKIETTLKTISVSSSRITQNGDLIVNFPDETSKEKASENLKSVFKKDVNVENLAKKHPKITVVGWPSDVPDDSLLSEICKKDETIDNMVKNGSKIELVKSWDMKNDRGVVETKKLAVTLSPDVYNYLMTQNKGYLYIGMSRCKVYDRYYVPQCYHCWKYYHYAQNCPNKNNNPTCGKCSGSHETKSCRSQHEKCANCSTSNKTLPNDHYAFSYNCPTYLREKQILIARTDYGRKN